MKHKDEHKNVQNWSAKMKYNSQKWSAKITYKIEAYLHCAKAERKKSVQHTQKRANRRQKWIVKKWSAKMNKTFSQK